MNIASAQYYQDFDGVINTVRVVMDDDEVLMVPKDEVGNRHWDALMEWVADGNTIAEAD
jgi:hypothetical protein|tara:strand:- start:1018 stop:1194 length:177 start_codon:yes stop_codon:yes gene_type:complete